MGPSLATSTFEKYLRCFAIVVFQMSLVVILFFVFIVLSVDSKPLDDPVCSYDRCPEYDPGALNVHIIPHSHDDVGWLKTVDQYYFQDVQNVLTTVLVALKQNPERRYVQVETAFFKKWWEHQSDAVKQDFLNLVNTGQIEFINGAWSMNDEAAAHYQSVIDQYTLGLRYLEDNIGKCGRPQVGWQIDPFGHSREQASISAQMGFQSLYFARNDHRDKDTRMNNRTMDLLWRGSNSLGNTSDIFTSVFYNHYSAPPGFCFDIVCSDDPIILDEESPDYNYEKRVADFANFLKKQSSVFPTNNILVTMGDDFRYQAAINTFLNIDRLLKGFDLFPQTDDTRPIKVFYSSPSCYAKAVNEYANTNNYTLQIKTDDFFPYSDGDNTYWTGYFTSRPASKGFERRGNNLLQVVKQLATVADVPYENEEIKQLKESMGILQHHDAITGTEKQHVANNYHLMLYNASVAATTLASSILSVLISGDSNVEDFGFKSCLLANISHCPESQSETFTVAIYNPLSRVASSPISIPVNYDSWIILDHEGQEIVNQISTPVIDYSFTDLDISPYNLEFVAKDLPPLSYSVYHFERSDSKKEATETNEVPRPSASLRFGYEDIAFEVDDTTGLISSVTMNNLTLEISQDFFYYSSQNSSGAYIFVPDPDGVTRISSGPVTITPISGEVYEGVIQDFGDWAKQVIKVYNDDRNYIEFDWTIGPIDNDPVGKEVISRYSSYLRTESDFYTDSNGREVLKRTRNFRPDYEYQNNQPVAGNYYPVNSKILIRDEANDVELAVLTDRSEGGSSITDGQLELMVHRACHHDDSRGVGEVLNEQEYGKGILIRGKHYLILGRREGNGEKSLAAIQRDVAQRKFLAPWTFITNRDVSDNLNNLQQSFLNEPLGDNVHVLSLEPWDDDRILLRLEHFLEKGEDDNLSQEVTVDVSNLLSTISISELVETNLGANLLLDEINVLHWPGSDDEDESSPISIKNRIKRDADDLNIELAPMQIRTFLASVEARH